MSENKNIIHDKRLRVKTTINEPDAVFYDIRKAPFDVYGFYNYTEEPQFKRTPDEVAKNTNRRTGELYLDTSGGRVRFSTDSAYIIIKAEMPTMTRMSHMPFANSAGFDLYIDAENDAESRFYLPFIPPQDAEGGYESRIKFKERKKRFVTINFPSYSQVENLYIGVQDDAYIGEGKKYRFNTPVVFYGSSITQGACASRPGHIYQNMLSRQLDFNYINLVFSGSCKGEDAMVDYITGLEMSAFVLDYDHNTPSVEHLQNTHRKVYDKIRASHPDIPIIMMSRPDFDADGDGGYEYSIRRRRVIIDTYHYAIDNGDKNVYFIDGEGIFRGPFEDTCTVDGTHPTDLGFMYIAQKLEAVFRRVINNGTFKE